MSRTEIWLVLILLQVLGYPYRLQAQTDIRYDPWDWVTYKNSQFVSSITEGREYIYFATNGGILRYQIFGKYWDYPITRSQGLSDEDVDAVYYDFFTHTLWASTSSGLNYSMEGGRRWELVPNETLALRPGERILRIGSTSEYLWCLTSSQILKMDHLSGYVVSPYADVSNEDVTWGSALLMDGERSLGILKDFSATGGWINNVDVLHGPQMEEVYVSTLYVDRFGDIWVGTWGGSVFFGDFQMRQLEPLSFGPAQTSSEIVLKTEQGIWMAGIDPSSRFSGITRYEPNRGNWDLFRVGYEITFGDDHVYCGTQVENEWWFGTPNGIQIYTPNQDSWVSISQSRGLPDNRITSIAFDGNYVYVGTPTGIVRMSPVSKTRISWKLADRIHRRPVYAIHWDGRHLWISTDINLWQWQVGTDLVHHYGIFGNSPEGTVPNPEYKPPDIMVPVTAIVSSDSVVYFGDEFGILSYHRDRGEWIRLTGESRLIGYQVLSLTLSGENDSLLWMGTSKGIFIVNLNDGYIRHLKKEDGLPSNAIRSSVIDGDIVWFGTPEGLVRFNWKRHLE